jgi:hypothetical protein
MAKKQAKSPKFENVKLKSSTVLALRVNKERTGVPISTFVEQAIVEKFASIQSKK